MALHLQSHSSGLHAQIIDIPEPYNSLRTRSTLFFLLSEVIEDQIISCRELCVSCSHSAIFLLPKTRMMRFQDFQYNLPKMKKQMLVIFSYDQEWLVNSKFISSFQFRQTHVLLRIEMQPSHFKLEIGLETSQFLIQAMSITLLQREAHLLPINKGRKY